MQKISTISHHQNEAATTPLVSDLVFDSARAEWVVLHQPQQVAPLPPKTDLVPRVATAGKNLVVGIGMIIGYGVLILVEAGGVILMTIGEFFQFLWLSSRRHTINTPERAEAPRKVEKTKIKVTVEIEA